MPGSIAVLAACAARLNNAAPSGLPALWFFTDPDRTPEPAAILARLPPGAGVIYRHFGAADRLRKARALRALCRRRGLVFLIGADAPLALRIGADGVHLPERAIAEAPRLPDDLIVTAAAHGSAALAEARRAGVDAAFLSPIFPTRSGDAAPIGHARAGAWAQAAGFPVYALGGVNTRTASRLLGRGFSGLAAIDAFLKAKS